MESEVQGFLARKMGEPSCQSMSLIVTIREAPFES